MDKIIGLGNALVDALAIIEDDNILTEMQLPKGSMTLIDEDKFLKLVSISAGWRRIWLTEVLPETQFGQWHALVRVRDSSEK